MRPINVVSLFEGMGCGAIALKMLGIPVGKYYSSEIDKWAIKQFNYMFPDYTQVGDVTKWREWDIKWSTINIIYGGSPCTGFSMAGKRLNFNDPQSKLFFVYVDILNHAKKHNPNVIFMLENVQMKKEWQAVINEHVGLFPVMIDASLVSAQVRKRLFWSNIKTKQVGLFGELHTDIPLPEDRNIYLKDILQPECEVDEKYYIKNPKFGFEGLNIEGKSRTIRTGGKSSQTDKHNYDIIKVDKSGKVKSKQNKASTFTAGGHSGGNHSDMDVICVAMRGRNPENPRDMRTGSPTEQRLEAKTDGKTNTLTTVSKDNLVLGFDIRSDEGIRLRENGKSGTLTARARTDESCGQNVITNYRLRRLTPLECMRLQSVPEWYKWHPDISESQKYKMLGNGWNCAVAAHNFSFLEWK